MEPPKPVSDINRQTQTSLNINEDNDKGKCESNSCNLLRLNSLDSLFSQSNSIDCIELNGDHLAEVAPSSQNCGGPGFPKEITQKEVEPSKSLFFQQRNESPWAARPDQNMFDLEMRTTDSWPKFYPVEAVLRKEELTIPLRRWITLDAQERATKLDQSYNDRLQKASLLRKVTISYAIAKLLQHLSLNVDIKQYSPGGFQQIFCIDNFDVRVSTEQSEIGWEVTGVNMINPLLELQIVTGVSSSCNFFDVVHDELTGRSIMSNIISTYVEPNDRGDFPTTNDESMLCHFLGLLLHSLFSGEDLTGIKPQALQKDGRYDEDTPLAKKSSFDRLSRTHGHNFSRSISLSGFDSNSCHGQEPLDVNLRCPLNTIGYSTALSHVVTDLVDCGLGFFRSGDSYPNLELAIADLCLLLEEPGRLLFKDLHTSQEGEHTITCANGKTRLYGRTVEARLITDTFCRVASTRGSKAVLIGGFSGSGKTGLVESVFEAVEAVGGIVVAQKFDVDSAMSPLAVVVSAFNDLCSLFAEQSTPQELNAIYESLVNEFRESFQVLVRALPNVRGMLSSCASRPISKNEIDTVTLENYSSLCFILQRFMRVISSTSHPIMLFLDDMQWADPVSLGLVHAVLSDNKGKNGMLFVGTFRDNEVSPDHIIFGFVDMLSQFNVPTSKIHLHGLAESDVQSMISDALGTLPRLCRSLSQVIFRKTNGNPYFVLAFLRSLVDRDLVRFSLRERRWTWDEVKVSAEDTTENMIYLLSNKISGLSESTKTALKCVSCLGMKIEKLVVQQLSSNSKYSNLNAALKKAVDDGFMDCDGTHYRFVHDRVRQVAYDLIDTDFKNQYHFELGMAMHSSYVYKNSTNALFATIEQINHGVPSLLIGTSHQNDVAELNYEASMKSMHFANFISAFDYIKAAVSLLSGDSWTTHYSRSLKYYLQLGKAASICGSSDEAKDALDKIIDCGKCLEHKIDAYYLLVANPSLESVRTCVRVLRLLGEELPNDDHLELCEINSALTETKEMFERESEDGLLCMRNPDQNTKRIENIMKLYGHLSVITWIAAPKMHAFYMARFAQFCLKTKIACKYLPSAFVGLGACLCSGLTSEAHNGYRIGKMGLVLLNRSKMDKDEACQVYLGYYRELGVLFEPMQACIDMHLRGYEFGMQVGNTSIAGLNLCLAVHREIISGKNLLLLKAEIEFYLKLAEQHSLTAIKVIMKIFYKNVLTLIGDQLIGTLQQNQGTQYEEIECTQEMMASFFSGHFDRVNYLSKKWETLSDKNNLKEAISVISVVLYNGLATTSLYRTRRFKFPQPLRNISQRLLPVLTRAEEYSQWNFKSKASILRAEYLSLSSKKEKAEVEYEIALSAARSSKFIHEEGLSCELAGMHYKHHGDKSKALEMFCQAKKCYDAWGSQLKVDQMESTIQGLK